MYRAGVRLAGALESCLTKNIPETWAVNHTGVSISLQIPERLPGRTEQGVSVLLQRKHQDSGQKSWRYASGHSTMKRFRIIEATQ